jgi:hypothetical protein
MQFATTSGNQAVSGSHAVSQKHAAALQAVQ